jgi:hypothetical protein
VVFGELSTVAVVLIWPSSTYSNPEIICLAAILEDDFGSLPLSPVLMTMSKDLERSFMSLSNLSKPASTSMISALGLVYLFESIELMNAVRFCCRQFGAIEQRKGGRLLTSRAFSFLGELPDAASAIARS